MEQTTTKELKERLRIAKEELTLCNYKKQIEALKVEGEVPVSSLQISAQGIIMNSPDFSIKQLIDMSEKMLINKNFKEYLKDLKEEAEKKSAGYLG